MRRKRYIALVAICFVAVPATPAILGSVVLFDPHRRVASAKLIDGWGHVQPLHNLGYLRVGIPKIEGAVQITCTNGKVIERGYVTPGAPTWLKIDHTIGCSIGQF
jgi:hypothetical protein